MLHVNSSTKGPLYSNMMIGKRLAFDGWTVTFGIAKGPSKPVFYSLQSPTKCIVID